VRALLLEAFNQKRFQLILFDEFHEVQIFEGLIIFNRPIELRQSKLKNGF